MKKNKKSKEMKEAKEEVLEHKGKNKLEGLAEPKPDDPDRELDKYELDHKMNMLMDAHDVMNNPKHMKQIREHAKMKKSKIESIADIRKAEAEMPASETDKPRYA